MGATGSGAFGEPVAPTQTRQQPGSNKSPQGSIGSDGGAAAAAAAFVLLGQPKDKFVYPRGAGSAVQERRAPRASGGLSEDLSTHSRRLYMRNVSSSVLQ